jgi:hypothetical protein
MFAKKKNDVILENVLLKNKNNNNKGKRPNLHIQQTYL